jgi:hypothetical protein
MTISDFQINSVIRTYMKNMKVKVRHVEQDHYSQPKEDQVQISEDGMKRALFERIEENMTERLKRHEQDG